MKKLEAYVSWNAGICRVVTYPGQKIITQGLSFVRQTNKARRLGYHVRVYTHFGSKVLKPIRVTPV